MKRYMCRYWTWTVQEGKGNLERASRPQARRHCGRGAGTGLPRPSICVYSTHPLTLSFPLLVCKQTPTKRSNKSPPTSPRRPSRGGPAAPPGAVPASTTADRHPPFWLRTARHHPLSSHTLPPTSTPTGGADQGGGGVDGRDGLPLASPSPHRPELVPSCRRRRRRPPCPWLGGAIFGSWNGEKFL